MLIFAVPVCWQTARLMIRSLNSQHLSTFLQEYKHLKHSEDTPQILTSNSEDKKQFYIYYTI